MRILLISGSFPPIKCGIGSYTERLAESLNQDDELDAVVLTHTSGKGSRNVVNKIERWSWSALSSIKQFVRDFDPDVIHYQYSSVMFSRWPFVNLIPLLLKLSFPSIPIMVTFHEYHNASLLGRFRVLLTTRGAKAVIISNDHDKNHLKKILKFKKIQKINIGVNITPSEYSSQIGEKLRTNHNIGSERLVGFVGYIDPAKGIVNLLEAGALLEEKASILLLSDYDKNNMYHDTLKQKIENLGLKVYWTGYLPDGEVSVLMRETALMVFPYQQPVSARRGTFITSLVHGLPTIATGRNTDDFVSGKNCILLPKMTPEYLSQSIDDLLKDPSARNKIAASAKDIAKDFSWTEISKNHKEIYSKGSRRG